MNWLELNYLTNKSIAELTKHMPKLEGDKLKESIRKIAAENIKRYKRGEEE